MCVCVGGAGGGGEGLCQDHIPKRLGKKIDGVHHEPEFPEDGG